MAKDERFNMMLSKDDAAMMRELAKASGESIATVVRQLVRRAYAEQFGEKKPSTKR